MSRIVVGFIVLTLVAWHLNPCACCPGGNLIHSRMDNAAACSPCDIVEGQSMQSCMQASTPSSQHGLMKCALNSGLNTVSQATPMLAPFVIITGGQITYVTHCHSVKKLNSAFTADIEEPPRV